MLTWRPYTWSVGADDRDSTSNVERIYISNIQYGWLPSAYFLECTKAIWILTLAFICLWHAFLCLLMLLLVLRSRDSFKVALVILLWSSYSSCRRALSWSSCKVKQKIVSIGITYLQMIHNLSNQIASSNIVFFIGNKRVKITQYQFNYMPIV